MSLSPTVVSYIDQVAKHVVSEILAALDAQEKEQDAAFSQRLMFQVLARYVGTIVYSTLQDRPEGNPDREHVEEYVMKNFASMKESVQNAVSAGFEGAMSTYSGKTMEYYCQVKNFGPAVNKRPI